MLKIIQEKTMPTEKWKKDELTIIYDANKSDDTFLNDYNSVELFINRFDEFVKKNKTEASYVNSTSYTFDDAIEKFCEEFPKAKNYNKAVQVLEESALSELVEIDKKFTNEDTHISFAKQPWFSNTTLRSITAKLKETNIEKTPIGGYKNKLNKLTILEGIDKKFEQIENIKQLQELYDETKKSPQYVTLKKYGTIVKNGTWNFLSSTKTDSCLALEKMFQEKAIALAKSALQKKEFDFKSQSENTDQTELRKSPFSPQPR